MIGRLAFRSLTAHPVRSGVLAAGFGIGVGVMAILLGVAEIVLEQAQSPALVGGGDVVIRIPPAVPARLLLAGTLQSDGLRDRVRIASPSHTTDLYLLRAGRSTRVTATGGIPSLERALGNEESSSIEAWRDSPDDTAWTRDTPEKVLRHIDRFHAIPDAPDWADSWAEWLYFNGRTDAARFYLTFLVGPRTPGGGRRAGVRLQLDRDGMVETFGGSANLADTDLQRAPDVTIGKSSIRLEGMTYRIHLDLEGAGGRRVVGDVALQASAGRLVPPFEVAGARGWQTGYVVPVMSGRLQGAIVVDGTRVSVDGGVGYHDHNWGFWRDVSWQWGQVQHEDLSFLFGRVFPPRDAADPDRLPGLVAALGPDGPLGFATDVRITEEDDERGQPSIVTVTARGDALDLVLRFDVASSTTTRMTDGPLANNVDFLQLRGQYTVTGSVGSREISFTAPGTAETFRGVRATAESGR
jgi:hypothetical protein